MKRFFLTLIALLMFAAFDAAALPKTHAKQVTADPSGLAHSTNTTVQLVLEDLDEKISVPATTTTPGVVRFSTAAEVNAGTGTVSVVTPADLKNATSLNGMHYSGATVYSGSMPTSYTDLDLSAPTRTNRCFVHLQVSPDEGVQRVVFRPNGETKEIGVDTAGHPTGTSGGATMGSTTATFYVSLITDAAGIIEWKSTAAGSGGTVIKLLGYQILQ